MKYSSRINLKGLTTVYELCKFNINDTECICNNLSLSVLLEKVSRNELTEKPVKLKTSQSLNRRDLCRAIINFNKGRFLLKAPMEITIIESSVIDVGGVRRQVLSDF